MKTKEEIISRLEELKEFYKYASLNESIGIQLEVDILKWVLGDEE